MKNERKNVVAGCIWSILNSEFTWLWTDSLHTGSYCPPIKKKSSNYASLPLYVHFSAHAHTHTHTYSQGLNHESAYIDLLDKDFIPLEF